MSLVIAIVLALTVLPAPWGLVAIAAAAVWELGTTLGAMWWSQRRQSVVGAETLRGRDVQVRQACRPVGQVNVKGELWKARCEHGAGTGEIVRVVGIDGLTLVVEPVGSPSRTRSRPEARERRAVP
jgi:membrane-bound serine protease (ClpP class)